MKFFLLYKRDKIKITKGTNGAIWPLGGQAAPLCKRLPRCKHHSVSYCSRKTSFGFINGLYSTNFTAAQQQLHQRYCLKHAQNCWRYELLHMKIALHFFCMVMQRSSEHKLHAFAVAYAPIAHTPISSPSAEQNTNSRKADHAEKFRNV